MKLRVLQVALAATLLACAFNATTASAQPTRVFVGAQGSDSNACTFAAPCRTFQHAHDVVAAGGEINVLDPAGYGAVTITKAISIQGHNFSGISTPSAGTGITINASASDDINLSGLIIEGAGIGQLGILFNTGSSLSIDNCVIRNVFNDGIRFAPNASSSLVVSNTFVARNGRGIVLNPTGSGTVRAVFNRVEVSNNGDTGIVVSGAASTGTIDATVTDSVVANNGTYGITTLTTPGQAAPSVMVVRSVSVNHTFAGLNRDGGGTVRLSQSTVTGNVQGLVGGILSDGDNVIEGNGCCEVTLGTFAKK